jgi:PAS domain-containing protein
MNGLPTDSLLFQWNFFERAISNYSVIIKMFQHMEAEKGLIGHMPRVFVEETLFDACEMVVRGTGQTGFFTVDGSLKPIDWEELEAEKGRIFSPGVLQGAFGYGTLYVYPLKRSIHVFGYLIFGKRQPLALDAITLRDLELLSEIMNRFILLNMRIEDLKAAEDARVNDLDSRLAMTTTLLERIIDQFPYSLFLLDRQGSICFMNRNARNEFMKGRELSGEKIEDVLPAIGRPFLEKDFIVQGEVHHRNGNGYRIYSLESYPIKDTKGRTIFKGLILRTSSTRRWRRRRVPTVGGWRVSASSPGGGPRFQ